MKSLRKALASELYERHGQPATLPGPEGYGPVVRWGADNRRPEHLNALILGQPMLSAGMDFNSSLLYGDGIIPVRREWDGTRWRLQPCYDYDEVNRWLEDNDANGYLMEAALDMVALNNVFVELGFNVAGTKIATLRHREATFSRYELADPATGQIQHHYYHNAWGREGFALSEVIVTPTLPRTHAVGTLQALVNAGRTRQQPRYVMPMSSPTLGRPYYARAWWESIIESGWMDFVQEIPAYKRAILQNGMHIKYQVEIRADFWDRLYQRKGARTDAERESVQREWLAQLDGFLKDNRNSGKSLVVESWPMGERYEQMVKIVPLRIEGPGGELLDDLEESSNIIAYSMGVHPSLIGASPGKNKTINGTEARELFIIKQGLLKRMRDRLLSPLYLVKAINGWPADLHFAVQNLELTTLDAGTGAVRTLSQPTLD